MNNGTYQWILKLTKELHLEIDEILSEVIGVLQLLNRV